MLLKTIKYHNFRPFIGDQKIELMDENYSENSKVIVILGENTFGKSTFVLSFIWCLYGESRFNRSDDILNKKVAAQMHSDGETETAYVEIEFDDDNKHYTMRRTQSFVKNDRGQLKASKTEANLTYVTQNGETKNVGKYQNEIDLVIKSILPLELSHFFFFEGEKNNEIKRKDLGKAVRTLLGLEAFDKMRSHLYGSQTQNVPYTNSVMGDYLRRQNDESNERFVQECSKMEQAEKEIKESEDDINSIDLEITRFEEMVDEINEKLRQAAPSKELQARRDGIAKEYEEVKKRLENRNKELFTLFNDESLPLFVMPLSMKIMEKLKKMKVDDKGIKGIEAAAIRELLKRGECLCGCDLAEGSPAYKNVARYIDFVAPNNIGTDIRDMIERVTVNDELCRDFINKFEECYKEIVSLRNAINRLEREDASIGEQLSKIDLFDINKSEDDLKKYKYKIAELREKRDKKLSYKSEKENEMKNAVKNMNLYKSKSEHAQKIHLYYMYAEAIYNWVNENYSKKEEVLRNRLNGYISELFNNMYAGKRDIWIDEKYNINMTYNGEEVDDTGGLRAIQYFAYVGGLVRLAYEIMIERENDEDENQKKMGEQYPLVLDAAFSHADEKHTKNIANELSKSVNQLILAIMKKDWVYAEEGLIGKVGRMYELNKIDETEVHILEVK